jgi:hypothetical protein
MGGEFPRLSQGFFVLGRPFYSFAKKFHSGPTAPPMIAQTTGK